MRIRQSLISRIDNHCKAVGITERTFGYEAVQDGRFVQRLRDGQVTFRVAERAEAYLDSIEKAVAESAINAPPDQAAA